MRFFLGVFVLACRWQARDPRGSALAASSARFVYAVRGLTSARGLSQSPCLATDGTNNWGVFQDNYARQGMLWSQTPDALSLWGFGGSCASAKPSLEGVFATPAETCPAINTAYNRDLYRSTNVPYTCNCTRTAFDLCVYQLQVRFPPASPTPSHSHGLQCRSATRVAARRTRFGSRRAPTSPSASVSATAK